MDDIFKDKKIILTYKDMKITGICMGINDCKRSIWCKNPGSYSITLYEGRKKSMKKREYMISGDTIYITINGEFKNDIIISRMFCEQLPKELKWSLLPEVNEWCPVNGLLYLMNNNLLGKYLTQKEIFVIMCRTGYSPSSLDHKSTSAITLRKLAGIMNITPERIRQIEAKALRKIRQINRMMERPIHRKMAEHKGNVITFTCCENTFDVIFSKNEFNINDLPTCPICGISTFII